MRCHKEKVAECVATSARSQECLGCSILKKVIEGPSISLYSGTIKKKCSETHVLRIFQWPKWWGFSMCLHVFCVFLLGTAALTCFLFCVFLRRAEETLSWRSPESDHAAPGTRWTKGRFACWFLLFPYMYVCICIVTIFWVVFLTRTLISPCNKSPYHGWPSLPKYLFNQLQLTRVERSFIIDNGELLVYRDHHPNAKVKAETSSPVVWRGAGLRGRIW